jgi:hypothetical protein
MAIPIKSDTPKVKKAPSRIIRSGDEDYDTLRKLACDLYIACQSMKSAHDFFRRATMGDDFVKVESANSNASIWFARPENQNYIAFRKAEIYKIGFDEYCKLKNIEHAEFTAVEDRVYERLISKTPAEVREETLIDLQRIIDNPEDDQILLAAIKQRTEITDAKYKDKGADISAEEKYVHFYLPAPICDTCPKRCEIEKQFESLPDIDLNLDEDDQEGN